MKRLLSVKSALVLWTAVVIAFLFTPLVFLVAASFNEYRSIFVWTGFSTEWWGTMMDDEPLKETVKNSLIVATISTLLSVALGTLAGVALERRPGRWTAVFMALVLMILVTPEIVDGAGQLSWFVQLGGVFRRGLLPVILVHTVFSSAVVTLIVRARVAGLEAHLEEAAADLFATPRRAFFQITLPLIVPAVVAGGMLAFTLSLDNVVATSFVSPAATTTFPNYVFGQQSGIIRPSIAAMATVLIGLTLLAIALVAIALRRGGQSGSEIAASLTGH